MYVQFWVEEPSMEAFLYAVMPSLLGGPENFGVVNFGDKGTLLSELPGRLKGLARWIPEDWRIVVLVDEDRHDCKTLKTRLEAACLAAGLSTRSTMPEGFRVLNRIVVEELEAWIFGDPEAIHSAFPRMSSSLGAKAQYRDPDAIKGGTWEALERELQGAGYYRAGIAKSQVAAAVGVHFVPSRNRSRSFQAFWNALTELVGGAT